MLILHARTILPVVRDPIDDGAVAIDNTTITHCDTYANLRSQFPDAEVIDLTDCAILPGLINAHTHLELSVLKDRVPFRGDFIDWVWRLGAARRELLTDLESCLTDACQKSLAAGVTTVGDICFKHRAWPYLAQMPIRKTCFAEVFGLTKDLDSPCLYLQQCIEQTQTDPLLRLGLSPHAPYSASAGVYNTAAELSAQHDLALTTHLAETPAEIDFLMHGTGPWLSYLQQIHRWDNSFVYPHQRPVEYFLQLDLSDQPFLLAHVNYLNDEELGALAQTNHSVVYCPRSHRFFNHPGHPFRRMLAASINVCLGTDSLASNSTLSILDEIRFLHDNYPDLAGETILQMATLNGARALGWDDKIGTITPGLEADLIAIPLNHPPTDPLSDILSSNTQPYLTMVRGKIINSSACSNHRG